MYSHTDDNLEHHLNQMVHDHRIYKVPEVAAILNVSDDLVRKLFGTDPECPKISEPKPGKRSYTTILIPGWVLKAALRRMMA